MNSETFSLFKFLESPQTFPNKRTKALKTEISTIKEILEDIYGTFSLSMNLKSNIFIKLQKNRGGYWDKKKFKDYFQIN